MSFTASAARELVAEDRLPGYHGYFLGNDPGRWRSAVPLYRAVRYVGIRPGVDVRAREQGGHFEYDLLLAPDADLAPIEITVDGVDRMHLDDQGTLVLETRLGPVRMPPPPTWEEGPAGERQAVACGYELRGANRFGFAAAPRRPGWALVVDPGLVWSTYLGGAGADRAHAVAFDAQGAATVAGFTGSTDFPTTPGAFATNPSAWGDVFVTRLAPDGASLVWSTFLGGKDYEVANAIALDAQGGATVAGETFSRDFPTTAAAFDTTHGGASDAFVTRLSPTGSSLVYSTFLGGIDADIVRAVALDAQGEAVVAGETSSTDFPTTPGAFDTLGDDLGDGFVTWLSATGSTLAWSTFLGGALTDRIHDLALDTAGTVTVAGETYSYDFPATPGAFDTTYGFGIWGGDGFAARFLPDGSGLVYATYLGGTGNDVANALALDAQGAATVAGQTSSVDFPTTPGAFDTTCNGYDGFITRLAPTGASLDYSTFLGGAATDTPRAIALDARRGATVAGTTRSPDFPVTEGAFDSSPNGLVDSFVTRLAPDGSRADYSTFLGGRSADDAMALALDARGAALVAGRTGSSDYPTTPGAFDRGFHGYDDAVLTVLDMLPAGVAAFGRSSAGCTGPLAISVTSMPRAGNAAFTLTCDNAPPNAPGVLALAGAGLTSPIAVLGVELWLDPASAFFLTFGANSDGLGGCDFGLPISNAGWLTGLQLAAQFFWAGPTVPPPCPRLGLSASHALAITIQR